MGVGIRDPAIRVNTPFKTTAQSQLKYWNQMQSQGCVTVQKSYWGGREDLAQRQSKRVEQWKMGLGCFQKEVHWSWVMS